MTSRSLLDQAQPLLDEVASVFSRMPPEVVAGLVDEISGARRIVLHSAGRTGLVLRAFVMRLYPGESHTEFSCTFERFGFHRRVV